MNTIMIMEKTKEKTMDKTMDKTMGKKLNYNNYEFYNKMC